MKAFGKTTRYFSEIVIRKRPYIKPEWIESVRMEKFAFKEVQPDGRIRCWIYIPEEKKYLRAVLLEDGETVHNAFFDRNFKRRKR